MTMMNELTAAKRVLMGMSGGVEPTPVLAAVSGGLDSMCLLHLLSTWGREHHMEITAAHFNHQLRGPLADRDEAFVREICADWGIPCVCGSGDTRAFAEREGLSLEEAARNLRYRFLEQTQRQGGQTFVLTAHHADDNAETMLLNLIRGTGLRGLTGIPDFRGGIARPFLRVTHEELAAYARTHDIPHIEDETNRLDDAARNVLRHKVLPVLKELNPRAVENMTRTAELLARDEKALTRETEELLRTVRVREDSAELPLEACQDRAGAVLSRTILSMMVHVSGRRRDLMAAHVEAAVDLVQGIPGREVSLPYGMTARRTDKTLLICCTASLPERVSIALGETVSFGGWTVALGKTPGAGQTYAVCAAEGLSVTAWRTTDRLCLSGSRGSRSLKRLCADMGIPPWQRNGLPVLRAGERPVAVPGIGLDMDFTPREGEAAVFVTFHQNVEEKTYEQ